MTAVALTPSADDGLTHYTIEASETGWAWQLAEAPERTTQAIAQTFSLPDVLARIMAARGFTKETAAAFLNPRLRDQLPDPADFKDMTRAAERVAAAIQKGEKIAIFGDYDVDGATSSALLSRYLKAVGCSALTYIPDRLKEGYGPNAPALLALAQKGYRVCVTVDCGTTAFAPLEAAAQAGLDMIVLDHHTAELSLPTAVAIVNPNRLDESKTYSNLAAVGVTYLFCIALNRMLRQQEYFKNASFQEPSLLELLDLVALGTVADVVPLTGLNRVFVTQGLEVMAQRKNAGITALLDVAHLQEKPQAWHLGFALGPRVNAGGRVGQSDLGTRLLTCENNAEAHSLAAELDRLNLDRRELEKSMVDEAIFEAQKQVEHGQRIVIIAHQQWHPGVIGIVASRVKDRFNLPTIVIGCHDGTWIGSGRSVHAIDLGAAVISAKNADLLIKGGGHKMAAGLTIDPAQLAAFHAFMNDRIAQQQSMLNERDLRPTHLCDGMLSVRAASVDFINQLDRLGPYGAGHHEPRFIFQNVRVSFAKTVGSEGEHINCQLLSLQGDRLKAIAFRAMSSAIGPLLLSNQNTLLHVMGTLKVDHWGSRLTPCLHIVDVARARTL